MNNRLTIILLAAFMTFLMLPLTNTTSTLPIHANNSVADVSDSGSRLELAGFQDEAEWWNSTFIYRQFFNITEPGVSDRVLTPVHLLLTFEEGHCHTDSLRLAYYDAPSWTLLPFQTWNTTYDATGEYVLSTRMSFMANVTAGSTEYNYYVYYAKINVGSVSYPDFYPFIYKSYTMSLISLVSYYDDNNYYIEKYDSVTETWNDPRNIDNIWSGASLPSNFVYPTNEPNGTINQYQAARYEPNTYSTTFFNGYYAVYSNYPMYVHMGQGDEGSNSAINDWFPLVDEMNSGTGTELIIGGVEGFDARNEGKYWIQAQEDDTEVWVTGSDGTADTNWRFNNYSLVSSWPAIIDAGEYIYKWGIVYSDIKVANATKPVSGRAGDVDASYSRDIWGFYPAIDGSLAGEEFYTIDMGNSIDKTRVTNLGDTTVNVDWYRNGDGLGFVYGGTLNIAANSSATINSGVAGDANPEDVLHIIGESGAMLMVEGVYNPTAAIDAGDWVPTITGHRYGTAYKLWGINSYKFMIVALENAEVQIDGYNGGTLQIPAGGMTAFRPISGSMTLYHINSNASIGIVDVGRFSTSSPYGPSGDTGYGWAVPGYSPEQDQAGFVVDMGNERHLFEFDITVVDLDGLAVEGASVTLYNSTTSAIWIDEQGKNRSSLSDANGLVVFEGLSDGSYEVRTQIDAKSWLTSSYSSVWVKNTSEHAITGSVTPIEIILPMGSFDVYLDDLMGQAMAQTPDETTTIRLSNITDTSSDGSIHIDQSTTDGSGWANFYRVPKDDYRFFVKYTGNVSSYQYDEILQFGNWSRSSSDFDLGPYSYTLDVPLVTIQTTLVTWDDNPVEGATIKINNTIDENKYALTKTSDANGQFNFYRILNGTWQFNVWKADNYDETPLARNNTEVLVNVQGLIASTIELPISTLNIRVITGPNTFVQGAQVNVTLRGGNLVVIGSTNSTGQLTFQFIHANMTSPYSVSYNVTVIAGNAKNGFLTELLLKVDKNWMYINNISISVPAYSDSYTELNATATYLTARWGRNATFTTGYYDRDGPDTTFAVTIGVSTWVNFTIYLGTTPIGYGYWSESLSFFITQDTDVNYHMIIDTDFWKLNVSETPYTIVMSAHTSGYDDPSTITLYLTVTPAQTSLGVSETSFIEEYGNHSSHAYWLFDSTNTANVTDLSIFSYVVKIGAATVRSGTLGESVHLYEILPSVLNGLDVGVYSITITLQKRNYINQTLAVGVSIIEIPMQVTLVSTYNYVWDPATTDFTFEYGFAGNATVPSLTSVSVVITWYTNAGMSYRNVTKTLSESGGVLTYTFARDIVPTGSWNISVTCSKHNYASATAALVSFITVFDAPTSLDAVSSDSLSIDWLTPAVFTIDFTRDSDSVGLTSANFNHNWTDSVAIEDLGGGIYRVTVSTHVESGTSVLRLNLLKTNHVSGTIDLTISIKTPLLIQSEFGSIETPLEVYWTQNFTIELTLWDQSRVSTPVDGATITYVWSFESSEVIIDEAGDLINYVGGLYNISIDASVGVPLDLLYPITITANLPGGTTDEIVIFVKILGVPSEVILETQFYEVFYADVFEASFYWNNTLDNLPINETDSELFLLHPLGTSILSYTNEGNGWYTITVDTKLLNMNVNLQGGVYVITIELEKTGYLDHELATVIILVRDTAATLEINPIGHVNWSDSFAVSAHLYDALHGGFVWIDAEVIVSYGPYSYALVNNLDGSFTGILNSSDWFWASAAGYILTFAYTLPNYVDNENTTLAFIDPIPGSIQLTGPSSYEWVWSQEFELSLIVWNEYGVSPSLMEYADVFYIWDGTGVFGQLQYNSTTRDYRVIVSSSEVKSGTYNFLVRVANENFTIPDKIIDFTINPVNAILVSDKSVYSVTYGAGTGQIIIDFAIDDDMVSLSGALVGATITLTFAGHQYGADPYDSNRYRITYDPTEIAISLIPGVFVLNITAQLQNYTTVTINPTLRLIAQTSLETGEFQIEEGLTLLLWFRFIDDASSTPIQATSITLAVSGGTVLSLGDFTYDTSNGRYSIELPSDAFGPRSTTPYSLAISIEAPLYQNITAGIISVTVTEATVDLLVPFNYLTEFLGMNIGEFRIALSLFQTIMMMLGIFIIGGVSYVSVKRWRVPYAIKQINKALKSMANGKVAKVENIKSMGAVVSELLAPGLAELDLAAPIIEAGPDADYAVSTDDTDTMLDELDVLDGLGLDDGTVDDASAAVFESELEAELDTVIETEPTKEPEITDIEAAETTKEAEETVEDSDEEVAEVVEETKESSDEAEADTIDESDEVEEPEPEAVEEAEVSVEESEMDRVEAIEEVIDEPDAETIEFEESGDDVTKSEIEDLDEEIDEVSDMNEIDESDSEEPIDGPSDDFIEDESDSEDLVEETSENEEVTSLVTPEELEIVGENLLAMGLSKDEVDEILNSAKDMTYSELLEVLDKIEEGMD